MFNHILQGSTMNFMRTLIFVLTSFVFSVCRLLAFQGDTMTVNVNPTINSKSLFVKYTFPFSTSKRELESSQRFGCTEYKIGNIIINKFQYWFNNYRIGERDAKQFISEIKQYDIDTTLLCSKSIRSFVSVFSGLKNAKKIVVLDANNDGDFTNDTLYEFDTLTTEKYYRGDTLDLAPLIKVRYESFDRGKIVSKYTFLRIIPYDLAYSYPNDLDRKLNVYFMPFVHREGKFHIGENNFKVSLMYSPKGHMEDYRMFYLTIQKTEKEYNYSEAAQVGETIVVDNHVFKAVACNREGSELRLLYEGYQENREGGMINNHIPDLRGKILNNSSINIKNILDDKKYVLLDFWGSWCMPCINSMPALKLLHTQTDTTKIQFVGIDYENNTTGQANAQKLLNRFNITWPQVAELSTDQTPLSFPVGLSVKNYPTFILISPAGKVVAREIGENGLPKIVETLKKIGLIDKP